MVDTCHVTGVVISPDGDPVPRATVRFQRLPHEVFVEDDRTGIPREVRAEADEDGGIAVDLIPGEYKAIIIARGYNQYPAFNVGVPDQPTAVLADIQDVPPPPSLDDAERAVRDARDYRDEAGNYASAASDSAQAAQTAEQSAQGHAQAAASSAQAAATSEQNAATSEGNASGYATAAGNSASAAATSAQNAANNASAAAGSASAASTSASNAADAKQAAEAAAQTAVTKAGEADASAQAALAATTVSYGVSIYHDNGVDEGAYYAERRAAAESRHTSLYVEVIDGAEGSEVTVALEVDDAAVFGPVMVVKGAPLHADELGITVPAGASVNWEVVTIAGTVRELFAKSYGKLV